MMRNTEESVSVDIIAENALTRSNETTKYAGSYSAIVTSSFKAIILDWKSAYKNTDKYLSPFTPVIGIDTQTLRTGKKTEKKYSRHETEMKTGENESEKQRKNEETEKK